MHTTQKKPRPGGLVNIAVSDWRTETVLAARQEQKSQAKAMDREDEGRCEGRSLLQRDLIPVIIDTGYWDMIREMRPPSSKLFNIESLWQVTKKSNAKIHSIVLHNNTALLAFQGEKAQRDVLQFDWHCNKLTPFKPFSGMEVIDMKPWRDTIVVADAAKDKGTISVFRKGVCIYKSDRKFCLASALGQTSGSDYIDASRVIAVSDLGFVFLAQGETGGPKRLAFTSMQSGPDSIKTIYSTSQDKVPLLPPLQVCTVKSQIFGCGQKSPIFSFRILPGKLVLDKALAVDEMLSFKAIGADSLYVVAAAAKLNSFNTYTLMLTDHDLQKLDEVSVKDSGLVMWPQQVKIVHLRGKRHVFVYSLRSRVISIEILPGGKFGQPKVLCIPNSQFVLGAFYPMKMWTDEVIVYGFNTLSIIKPSHLLTAAETQRKAEISKLQNPQTNK